MVGNLKGIGKIYLQTVVDCHSRFGFGHLYTSKVPVTAVHVLNDKVLPFFEAACEQIKKRASFLALFSASRTGRVVTGYLPVAAL